jgi:4-diphosphocytidyl-2-C-methyl-D-erythritol kinase
MNSFQCIEAPSKLNLNLFVTGINDKGLHLLKSHVCFLELSDQIYIKYNLEDEFHQTSKNNLLLVNPKNNLLSKTIDAFRLYTNWTQNFKIILDKKIPIGAGLGGGSADAAATLILLSTLYNNNKDIKQKITSISLNKIALSLGSDVPACLKGRDLLLEGYGEKLTKSVIPNGYYFLLINPNVNLSTKSVFDQYKKFIKDTNHNTNLYFESIPIYNSLLSSAIMLAPSISFILSNLKNASNITTYGMTGSGSTCFGIFKNLEDIIVFKEKFLKISNHPFFIWYGKKKNYRFNRVTNSKVLENNF